MSDLKDMSLEQLGKALDNINPELQRAVELELRRRDEAVKRLVKAMRDICWYDWCDNDRDAVAAIERGRTALASLTGDV